MKTIKPGVSEAAVANTFTLRRRHMLTLPCASNILDVLPTCDKQLSITINKLEMSMANSVRKVC